MRVIKINKNKISKKEISLIADFLEKGKVVVYPTDTIYGLGCLATKKGAIDKIYKIKNREKNKPFLVLISGWKMAVKYFFISSIQRSFLKNIWPGKVSVILKHKELFPKNLLAGLQTSAVRLPKDKFLIKIIKAVGVPIVSTSLNLSHQQPLSDVENISEYFKKLKPDLVINAGVKNSKVSKLVDITDIKNIKILRK